MAVAGLSTPSARRAGISGWLILPALAIGLVSLLSYSLTASELMRWDYPAFAVWWEAHQFYFMEGGATAFGLLLGISIGGALVAGADQRSRTDWAAFVLAIVGFAPLIHACAAAARLGWTGNSASIANWIISHEGYSTGRQIDKVVITGVYFLKTAGLALLCGFGVVAIVCAAILAFDSANKTSERLDG
jgi:hypothetical protein